VITIVLGAALTATDDGIGPVVVTGGAVGDGAADEGAVAAGDDAAVTPAGGGGSGAAERATTSPADATPAHPSAASDTMERTRRSTRKSR
jgi:hypothetical protein